MPESSDQHHSRVKKKVTVNNNGGHTAALFEQRLKAARKNSQKIHIVLQRYCVAIPLVARASDDSLSTNQSSGESVAIGTIVLGTPMEGSQKKWYGSELGYHSQLLTMETAKIAYRTTQWK